MTHVFLTGAIQVGKSTAIGKALALLGNPSVGGFRTVSLPCPEIPRARFAVYVLPGAVPYIYPLTEESLAGFPWIGTICWPSAGAIPCTRRFRRLLSAAVCPC